MKRSSLALVVVTLFAAVGLSLHSQAQAQNQAPSPARSRSEEMLDRWNDIGNKLVAMAKDFPEDKYDFKPTPESMSFKAIVAHAADSAMGACSGFNGERKTAGAAQMTSKADLVGAVKAAQTECDKAYGGLTDAKAVEMVAGRGGQRSRVSTLWGNTVHIEHEYAQMAVLMRLKGQVPPSSDRPMGGGGKKQ